MKTVFQKTIGRETPTKLAHEDALCFAANDAHPRAGACAGDLTPTAVPAWRGRLRPSIGRCWSISRLPLQRWPNNSACRRPGIDLEILFLFGISIPMLFSLRRLSMVLVLLTSAATRAGDSVSWNEFLGFTRDVQVVTLTESTEAGNQLRRPTPSEPVYYFAKSLGFHHWGEVVRGDREPDEGEAIKMIQKILAKQGYLPAKDGHPATLFLVFNWGTYNVDKEGGPLARKSQSEMRQFLFGKAAGFDLGYGLDIEVDTGLLLVDNNHKAIADMLSGNLYVATITAFDLGALVRTKKKELLWITRIACPSLGLALDRTLPTMVAVAGPNIGRDMGGPILIRASDKFKASVDIADPVVLEYIESEKTQVSRSKPPSQGKVQ